MDLLRILQERRFYRVGGSEEVQVDVRVIAATNVDLEEAVKEGSFRDDLYYRLNVINIRIPALRERPEDIPLLARSFVERLSHELGRNISDITEGALGLLMDRSWPGNVRQLENVIERAMVTCKNRVLAEEDFGFLGRDESAMGGWSVPTGLPLHEIEKQVISTTLQRTEGNIKETAGILGIDRSTLYQKIKKYNIPR
jgi:DNA-binding NtrC family response regulator